MFVFRVNSSREDEIDLFAVEIIEKSLELFNSTLTLIRDSTRAGGHVTQNVTMMGAWLLTNGILGQVTNSNQIVSRDGKSRSVEEVEVKIKDMISFRHYSS